MSACETLKGAIKSLVVNSKETVRKLNEEVRNEFITSSSEVYKEALRSLIKQENILLKQIDTIRQDRDELSFVTTELERAFVEGNLISMEDAKRICQEAKREFKTKPILQNITIKQPDFKPNEDIIHTDIEDKDKLPL